MTVWTPEREQAARDLMAGGLSASHVAARLGTTRNSVLGRMFRTRHGKRINQESRCLGTGHARKVPVDCHADILARWHGGMIQKDIARLYGVSQSIVHRICKKYSEAAQ